MSEWIRIENTMFNLDLVDMLDIGMESITFTFSDNSTIKFCIEDKNAELNDGYISKKGFDLLIKHLKNITKIAVDII